MTPKHNDNPQDFAAEAAQRLAVELDLPPSPEQIASAAAFLRSRAAQKETEAP